MKYFLSVSVFLFLVGCGKEAEHNGQTISHWRHALQDPNPKVRIEAANAIGTLGGQAKSAVPELIAAIQDKHDAVRVKAATALWSISQDAKEAVPALTAALKDQSAEVRLCAAGALGEIGPDARESIA